MNTMVRYMVELLFQDVEESPEVLALRDEVMANCQAHYEDLIHRGLSDDEALAAVTESLQGMEDVVKQYPRKKAAEWIPDMKVPDHEDPAFSKNAHADTDSEIEAIEMNLRGWDVTMEPSENGLLNIRYDAEDHSNIEVHREGKRLILKEVMAKADNGSAMDELKHVKWDSFDEMVRGVKMVTKIAMKSVSSAISGMTGRIILEVPGVLKTVRHHAISGDMKVDSVKILDLNTETTSGEIEVTAGLATERLRAHSTSGDITINALAQEMDLNTLSGDIELNGSAVKLNASTVSGDIELNTRSLSPEQIQLKSTSGDIDADLSQTSTRKLNASSVSGDVSVTMPMHEHHVHAELHSVSGSCVNQITDAGSLADVQLNLQTMSGDVRLERA